jgi:hypothetical protein
MMVGDFLYLQWHESQFFDIIYYDRMPCPQALLSHYEIQEVYK